MGIEEKVESNSFYSIYPNPATNEIVVVVNEKIINEKIYYELLNNAGNTLQKGYLQKGKEKQVIGCEGLASGRYTIILRYKNKKESKKIIKID